MTATLSVLHECGREGPRSHLGRQAIVIGAPRRRPQEIRACRPFRSCRWVRTGRLLLGESGHAAIRADRLLPSSGRSFASARPCLLDRRRAANAGRCSRLNRLGAAVSRLPVVRLLQLPKPSSQARDRLDASYRRASGSQGVCWRRASSPPSKRFGRGDRVAALHQRQRRRSRGSRGCVTPRGAVWSRLPLWRHCRSGEQAARDASGVRFRPDQGSRRLVSFGCVPTRRHQAIEPGGPVFRALLRNGGQLSRSTCAPSRGERRSGMIRGTECGDRGSRIDSGVGRGAPAPFIPIG